MAARVSIFIPAYNAEKHITSVIHRIPASFFSTINKIWIINDGSKDNTLEVARKLAESNPKLCIIDIQTNQGYGPTVRKGLDSCREDGCEIAVCLHADGQYPPESLPCLIDTMTSKSIDILQGSRIASGTALSGGMPLYKFFANRVLTLLENIVFSLKMSDYHSGMLVYSRKALDTIPFDKLSNSFDFDLEVIASARSLGLSISESPIPTRYADEVSYLNPISYGLRTIRVMFNYITGKYQPS